MNHDNVLSTSFFTAKDQPDTACYRWLSDVVLFMWNSLYKTLALVWTFFGQTTCVLFANAIQTFAPFLFYFLS